MPTVQMMDDIDYMRSLITCSDDDLHTITLIDRLIYNSPFSASLDRNP